MVDAAFISAASSNDRRRFHTFEPFCEPVVVGVLGSWIPQHDCSMVEHVKYWDGNMGPSWPTTTDIDEQIANFDEGSHFRARSVRVDARMAGFSRTPDCSAWIRTNLHTAMTSAALVCRIAIPNPSLRVLHLRLSAHADLYTLVENIIATNTRLTDIVIEDDSHPELDGLRRPILDIGSLCKVGEESSYTPLDRFVLRAPSVSVNAVESAPFFRRLRSASTVCLAAYEFVTRTPVWDWVVELAGTARYVERLEVATSMSETGNYRRGRHDSLQTHLPNLRHLHLDLHEVDVRLLFRLHAPNLKYLQIRSYREVGAHGALAHGHFPNLFVVTVWCPGAAIDRFRAVGLKRHEFIHYLPRRVLFEPQFNRELAVYLNQPTVATDPTVVFARPPKRARHDESPRTPPTRHHSV
ncbi:hypothetical protein A4X13_0g7709 [Tilletia indica]|uniref:Uncharacterized protein n=1 Tax=Tilletia indica TaxID=43049 RepID=A0A177TIS8_9BASI|nr:hypothetical protein A4X13_0g7709 [Tilletia indica]